jgi:heme/copper-type cytochrome/quinol oxidase subunit 2
MRQLLTFVVLFVAMYFAWSYLPSKDKGAAKRFLFKHMPMVAFIIITIFIVLVIQFNIKSITLL